MAERPSILVLRLSSLGDVLFALPAVQHLLASGVAGHVCWLVEDRAAGLLDMVDGLDEVLVFPRRQRRRWAAFARRLTARRDDIVLDFQGNLKSRLMRLFLRAPASLGYDRPLAREGSQKGLTTAYLPPAQARHRVASHLSMLSLLGIAPPDPVPRPRLRWDAAATASAAATFAALPGDGPVVVLHPGTSAFGELKRWSPEQFVALGRELAGVHGARLLITGGPGEETLVASLARGLGGRAHVVPPAGLQALAALLSAADLVVAADSLPLHLANALGTPVVALYGPKDPAVTGPFFDGATIVRSGVGCSPCTLRRCDDRICMAQLAPSVVARHALAALGRDRPPSTPAGASATPGTPGAPATSTTPRSAR